MTVEVILKKPITNLGAEGDVVRVKPGFARNYLLPEGMAVPATLASKRQIEGLKKIRAEREAEEQNKAQELAGKLNKVTVTFQMETASHSEGEVKVFGSVTNQEIVSRLAEMGHEIERKQLQLSQPLKALGEHVITVNLLQGIQAKVKVVLTTNTPLVEKETTTSKKKGEKGAIKASAKKSKASAQTE